METNKNEVPEDRWEHKSGPRDSLWTYGLEYKYDGESYFEEIDLWAPNADEAERRVRLVAAQDYEPGWERLVPMAPGGSAGLVFWP